MSHQVPRRYWSKNPWLLWIPTKCKNKFRLPRQQTWNSFEGGFTFTPHLKYRSCGASCFPSCKSYPFLATHMHFLLLGRSGPQHQKTLKSIGPSNWKKQFLGGGLGLQNFLRHMDYLFRSIPFPENCHLNNCNSYLMHFYRKLSVQLSFNWILSACFVSPNSELSLNPKETVVPHCQGAWKIQLFRGEKKTGMIQEPWKDPQFFFSIPQSWDASLVPSCNWRAKLNTVQTQFERSTPIRLIIGQKRGSETVVARILHCSNPRNFSLSELRWKTFTVPLWTSAGAQPIQRRVNQSRTQASWIFLCCWCPELVRLIESHQENLRSLQSRNGLLVEDRSHTRAEVQAPNGSGFHSCRTISPLLDEDLFGMGKHHARHSMKRDSPDRCVVNALRWSRMLHQRSRRHKGQSPSPSINDWAWAGFQGWVAKAHAWIFPPIPRELLPYAVA